MKTFQKIPSELEVAPLLTLLTLCTLFILLKLLYTVKHQHQCLNILLGEV